MHTFEGVQKCEARNHSVADILGGLRTRNVHYDALANFHHVIWLGDLNYRISFDEQCPRNSILSSEGQVAAKEANNIRISGRRSSLLSVFSRMSSPRLANSNIDSANDDIVAAYAAKNELKQESDRYTLNYVFLLVLFSFHFT